MSNKAYPITTLKPMQSICFVLSNGSHVQAQLEPIPDQSGMKVSHVDLACTSAGGTQFVGFTSAENYWSIIQAAQHAFNFALSEAQSFASTIVEIRLEGEEFLDQNDISQIAGTSIQISIV